MAALAGIIAEKAGFAIAGLVASGMGIDLSFIGIGDSEELQQIQLIRKELTRIIDGQEALKIQLADFEKSVNAQFSAATIRPPALRIMAQTEEWNRVLKNFEAQKTTKKLGDYEQFKNLQTDVRRHCRSDLSVYTAGCIDLSDGHSYVYDTLESFYSKHINATAHISYGLHQFVTDLRNVLLRMTHIQHTARLLLCRFVAVDDDDRRDFVEKEKATLIKQAEVLQGFVPRGISLDDGYGDRDLIARGSASNPNDAWQLLDVGNTKQSLSSHHWAVPPPPGIAQRQPHWVPYVNISDGTTPAHMRWQFYRQESGLYKVWNPAAKAYIRFSKDCEYVYQHPHNKDSMGQTLLFPYGLNHSTYHINPKWGLAVLFKLIVLKPTDKNPDAWRIRLVDSDYGSKPDDVPRLFAGWGGEEANFLLAAI